MSTIPKNPNISLEFSPDDHKLVKTEINGDGDGDGEPGEASGSATCPEGFSSWDSDSEPEVVGKIFTNDKPWFNVADGYVVHDEALDEALDKFEAQCDQDTPLKFRLFVETAVRKLRRSLDDRLKFVFLLDEEDDSASGRRPGEFTRWSQELVFPVKRRRSTRSIPSDSPKF